MAHVRHANNLAALLEQPNPVIDLKIAPFEASTRNFIQAVVNYKNKSISAITERRKQQALEKKRIAEKVHNIETETNQCKLKEIELVAQLEREKEERKDAELSVAAFKRQLALLKDKTASVDADIEQYTAQVQNLSREKNKERSTLSNHASFVPPETQSCESRLACSVEGVAKDRLLIQFFQLDPSKPDNPASFVLDVSSQNFTVITATPHLPTMPMLVGTLNETKDIYAFVKSVRMAYAALFANN